MRIMFFGDSNTWGFNATNRMRYENRYTKLIKDVMCEHEIIEEGLCGRTLCQNDPYDIDRNGNNDIQMLIKTHLPLDMIVVMLGTNDAKRMFNTNVYSLEKGMNALIDKIFTDGLYKHGFNRPKVLIVSPPIMHESYINNENTRINFGKEGYEIIEKAPIHLRNVANFYGVEFIDTQVKAGSLDGIHLDEEGHRQLADKLIEKIRSIDK